MRKSVGVYRLDSSPSESQKTNMALATIGFTIHLVNFFTKDVNVVKCRTFWRRCSVSTFLSSCPVLVKDLCKIKPFNRINEGNLLWQQGNFFLTDPLMEDKATVEWLLGINLEGTLWLNYDHFESHVCIDFLTPY